MEKSDFENCYDSFSGAVYRTAFLILRNRSDAEDITQEAFIALYKRYKPFNEQEHIKAWLLRVCSNKAKNLLKRRNVERKHLKIPEDNIANDSGVLNKVLLLKPTERTVIYLFYFEGYSTEEISKIVGRSGGAVRVILSRARLSLKLILEND